MKGFTAKDAKGAKEPLRTVRICRSTASVNDLHRVSLASFVVLGGETFPGL